MPVYFPQALFGGVAALCFALALLQWNARQRVTLALSLGGFSLLCFVTNRAWARYSIRVDLLLTIPAISLAAIVVGGSAALRPFLPARVVGAVLALGGAASFTWFSYASYRTAVEGARTTALYDEGARLFWDETIRCEDNFEKRFGPVTRRDDPCLGNLAVRSKSPNAYPFTRIVINDRGEAQLLFSSQKGAETPVGLRPEVFARMVRADSGEWSGDGDSGFGPTHLELLARGQQCEARITRRGATSIFSLEREELPPCHRPANPPVTYLGPWGEIAIDPSGTRRLLQIWLWAEDSGHGRGVLLNDVAPGGMRRDFIFLKHFRATRSAGDRWILVLEEPDTATATSLAMTIDGQNTRVLGPANFVGPKGEAILEKKEFATDPRIELVPVHDQSLFNRYLESALFNLDLSWTAP